MIGLHLRFVRFNNLDITQHQETSCRNVVGFLLRCRSLHQIARYLLANETIEWLVIVESFDQVIAITPSVLSENTVRCADHVGITSQI